MPELQKKLEGEGYEQQEIKKKKSEKGKFKAGSATIEQKKILVTENNEEKERNLNDEMIKK